MSDPQILTTAYGAEIAYHLTPGRQPGVIFLTGFMSNMDGTKALHLEQHLRQRGNQFLRFDYRGHGKSSDRFENGSIGDWLEDAISALDQLTGGPQVLVGSSMGGWIMLLTALARKERVAGLLGLASAPDFTDTLSLRYLNDAQRQQLYDEGHIALSSDYDGSYDNPGYIITRHLLDEGHRHRLLHQPIALDVPVRLIHGMQDTDVPWQTSLRLSEELVSEDVEVTLIKAGDHRLSSPAALQRLCDTLDELLDGLEKAD